MQAPEFKEWFSAKLKVTGFPQITEIVDERNMYGSFDIVINVSDEFDISYCNQIWLSGKHNYWFPMGEAWDNMGMSSIYGALTVLYQAYQRNLSVLLHCHAGANRSPTVHAAFFYLMTGYHLPEEKTERKLIFTRCNMLQGNCGKHLPDLAKMEQWLQALRHAFDNADKYNGGMYDWSLRRADLT